MISQNVKDYDLVLINTPALDYSFIKQNDQNGVPPLGLGSIANYCTARGFKVKILDADRLKMSPEKIVDEVNGIKTRFVGLNAVSENIKLAQRISSRIKYPVILGGIHVTLLPEETIKQFPFLYALVVGEGEVPVLKILSKIKRKNIPSILFKSGKIIVANPRCEFLDLNEIPLPSVDLFETNDEYYLITSRGCPYNCAFCASPILSQRVVRFIPINKVIAEMVMAYQKGHTYFHFLDDQFLVSQKRAEEFINGLKTSGLYGKIGWRGMARADAIQKMNGDLCRQLKNSGGDLISIGIESGCQRILQLVHKKITNGVVKEATSKLARIGFRVKGFFILGFPDETYEEMMETRDLIMSLGEIGMEYFNIAVLRPYPGTEIYYRLLGKGYKPEDIFFEEPTDRDGVNRKYIHGFYNRLNSEIHIANLSNEETRKIASQIINEFEKKFN